MSDKKDLKSEAKELGKALAEAEYERKKELEEEEAQKNAKKEKKADEGKTVDNGAINMKALNNAYGISQSTFDKVVERDFHPDNVREYAGKQTDEEAKKVKTSLFFRALVGMKTHPEIPQFALTVKALSEGTDADGGYLVEPEFRGTVLRQLHHEGIMRPEVNVIPTTKDQVDFNSEDGRPQVTWGSENTSISTTTAGLAQTSISVHRMNAIMYMSREVVADSDPSITDWIRDELTTAVRLEEDAVLIGGSGSGRPKGVDQLSLTTNAAGSSLTFEDYLDLKYTLPIQYRTRNNVKWYMNSNTLRDAQKLKDDNSMPIFIKDMSNSTPGTVLGDSVVLHDNFADGEIYYGDLKQTYIMLDRQSLAVETTTEGGDTFAKHQIGIKIVERIGGDAVRTEGLVKGTGYSA